MSSRREKLVKSPWSFEDVVDFEYAIRLESNDSSDRIEKRDHEILDRIQDEKSDLASNRYILKFWLDSIKETLFPSTWNPGELSNTAISLASKVVFAIALISGVTMAAGFLSYEGSEPVNVSAYIGIFIILQFALAAVSLLLIVLLRLTKTAFDCFLGIRILRPIFFHLAASLIRYAASRITSEHRSVVKDASGDLKNIWVIYRGLLQWKAFAHFQAWAIAFNIGVIGTTVIIVLFSDRAFGWQTTLQVDAEWLYQIVRFTSLPWSWFAGEGVGFPSLGEIEGSRIILKDGIRSLNSGDLVSWWPYLCLGTAFYGLIPRLVFYAWGRLSFGYCLNRLCFSHTEANRIAGRIRSRDLGFDSNADRRGSEGDMPVSRDGDEGSMPSPVSGQAAICLLASDYHEELPAEKLKEELSRKLCLRVDQLQVLPISTEVQMEPESLTLEIDPSASEVLFIVFPSWLPPIEEIKQLILAVRKNIGPQRSLYIEVLGPLDSKNALQDAKPQEISMWTTFIRRLGDPFCALNPPTE